jgi:hypothetical protein
MDQALLGLGELHVAREIVRDLEVDEAMDEILPAGLVLGMAALLGVEDQADVGIEGVVGARHEVAHVLLHPLVALREVDLDVVENLALAALHGEEHALEPGAQTRDLVREVERLRGVDALDIGVDRALAQLGVESAEADVALEQVLDQLPAAGAVELRRCEHLGPGGPGPSDEHERQQASDRADRPAVGRGPERVRDPTDMDEAFAHHCSHDRDRRWSRQVHRRIRVDFHSAPGPGELSPAKTSYARRPEIRECARPECNSPATVTDRPKGVRNASGTRPNPAQTSPNEAKRR